MTQDLANALESSIEAAQTGGEFVPAWRLPSEEALTAAHAELERLIRSQRRVRCEVVVVMAFSEGCR